ncbi:MAG: UDP-N-acetylmuramoyl-tripeptide--D-alanyl-D-alanine ligase [Actinobacteria bacterium]|uniref:UDP-MurNAc-pentapeptide synthetase n=1 Tax=freshwater metagenome TaxID=449393 RepID=A0A6J7SPT4_9ZZZZ|nr:UDP-N-acetylmuramoyl-tripeptide--D-alanyl-D-alanine ligase [Actinomycetota bacterium]
MIALTAAEIAVITQGRLGQGTDPQLVVTGIARIDSRDLSPGDLFVAFEGETLDGHDFVQQAMSNGAALSLVTRPVAGPHVVVSNMLDAVSALARHNAQALQSTCTIIGLTGSSGKTSTKDLLASVLETAGETVAPPGSFNNELGFPLTVLRANLNTKYLVLEMGARGVGHLALLCSIAQPKVGIVLNVGAAHLGEFGDLETTARAKSEVVATLPADGIAVLNSDDDRVRVMTTVTKARCVYFGDSDDALVGAENVIVGTDGCARFDLRISGSASERVALKVAGRHQVSNALAVAATAISIGISPQAVAEALSNAGPRSPWRMQVEQGANDVTVINDAYNANPDSMQAALVAAADIANGRRLGIVVGEMLELGNQSGTAHVALGTAVAKAAPAWVIAVGSVSEQIESGAVSAGVSPDVISRVDDAPLAIRKALELAQPGDVVLIKASRGIGLEVVAQALVGGDKS